MPDSASEDPRGDASPTGPTTAPTTLSRGPTKVPVVRLQSWVIIVLLLTLLASCSAASSAGDAADSAADVSFSGQAASTQDVQDLCRLIGAVAAAQGVDLEAVTAAEEDTSCAQIARQGAGG